MRALVLGGHGGLEQLTIRDDLPVPELDGPHAVRLRMFAVALNRLDLFVLEGWPGLTLTPSWVPLADGTGVVDAIGSAVTRVHVGDTVVINPGSSCRDCAYCRNGQQPLCLKYQILGEDRTGTAAEFVVVPEFNVDTVPAAVDVDARAGFGLASLTAYRMVVGKAKVQSGEQVLIWGIGGGVALAAMQLAKARGATVWVTSSDPAKLARAAAMGADHVLNHATDDVPRVIRAATGKRGVEVVIDSVGSATWTRSLGSLARGGRLVTCGGTSGPMLETDVRRLFMNQWTISGSTMGSEAEWDAVVSEFPVRRVAATDRLRVSAGRGTVGLRAAAVGATVRQSRPPDRSVSEGTPDDGPASDGAVDGGPAQYSQSEQASIRAAVLAEAAPRCPRCPAHPVMVRKGIGGGSFGLGYQRKRDWFVCPSCHRSAIFDLKRGTRN